MSLAIVWRPTDHNDQKLDVPAPSSFVDMMAAVGYRLPCTLEGDDRLVLAGMSVVFAHKSDDNTPNPFKQLVDLLDLYDSIDLSILA
jgi:hypothetical protein